MGSPRSNASASTSETRQFRVHPHIIKTLIREQAGTLTKAFGELIMNAVDAGASRIDLKIDESGAFTLSDNGKGFKDRQEVESFWETFGTPHQEGDAVYGKFRIGRGQIMSYASTRWRSGHFEMTVDLEAAADVFGYELTEHEQNQPGCTITGNLYKAAGSNVTEHFRLLKNELDDWDSSADSTLESLVRFIPVPLFINEVQVNSPAAEFIWDAEDEHAWFKFDREGANLDIYNMGVFVTSLNSYRYGIGGTICSKRPLRLNLARNAVIEHECQSWGSIKNAVHAQFASELKGVKRLNKHEATALLHSLCYGEEPVARKHICKLRFVPDIWGEMKTPDAMLTGEVFTVFDGRHTGIAERVQSHGLATVLMPSMFRDLRANVTDSNAIEILNRLRAKIYGFARDNFTVKPFKSFVTELRDTSRLVDDCDLNPEELMVLNLLRKINLRVSRMTNGSEGTTRRIIAGEADCYQGWTDSLTYIAIKRELLAGMRWETIGPTRLVTLMVHEYAHLEGSVGDHEHDFEFMNRFHEAMFNHDYGSIVNDLQKDYIAGLCKLNIVPSAYTGAYVRKLAGLNEKLPRRSKAKSSM